LKGEAATLGAAGVVGVCAALESMPAPLDIPVARELMARVEREMGLVRATLKAEADAAGVS
jgi:hypothetical protein